MTSAHPDKSYVGEKTKPRELRDAASFQIYDAKRKEIIEEGQTPQPFCPVVHYYTICPSYVLTLIAADVSEGKQSPARERHKYPPQEPLLFHAP